MKVTNGVGTVSRLYIEEVSGLDPVTVLLENFAAGVGRITIICWGEVWTSFWGGMNGDSVEKFFLRCGSEYLADNLSAGNKRTKAKTAYLLRIIEAVKAGLVVESEKE